MAPSFAEFGALVIGFHVRFSHLLTRAYILSHLSIFCRGRRCSYIIRQITVFNVWDFEIDPNTANFHLVQRNNHVRMGRL